jgi:hypothetical protein
MGTSDDALIRARLEQRRTLANASEIAAIRAERRRSRPSWARARPEGHRHEVPFGYNLIGLEARTFVAVAAHWG